MKLKKKLTAIVLKLPKKRVGATTQFLIAYGANGEKTYIETTNTEWSKKIKEIIVVNESLMP